MAAAAPTLTFPILVYGLKDPNPDGSFRILQLPKSRNLDGTPNWAAGTKPMYCNSGPGADMLGRWRPSPLLRLAISTSTKLGPAGNQFSYTAEELKGRTNEQADASEAFEQSLYFEDWMPFNTTHHFYDNVKVILFEIDPVTLSVKPYALPEGVCYEPEKRHVRERRERLASQNHLLTMRDEVQRNQSSIKGNYINNSNAIKAHPDMRKPAVQANNPTVSMPASIVDSAGAGAGPAIVNQPGTAAAHSANRPLEVKAVHEQQQAFAQVVATYPPLTGADLKSAVDHVPAQVGVTTNSDALNVGNAEVPQLTEAQKQALCLLFAFATGRGFTPAVPGEKNKDHQHRGAGPQ